MTAQVPDSLIYNSVSYSIVGLKGEGLPSPLDFNLMPVSPSTANWRGFIMTYTILERHLLLHEMQVTVEDTKGKHPVINEVNPEIKKDGRIRLTYKNLKLHTKFTGEILIAKDFIGSMYVHMGFQSPLSFETVIEVKFEEGVLIKLRNISNKMNNLRKNDISDGKLKSTADPQTWIARTFSLDYDF